MLYRSPDRLPKYYNNLSLFLAGGISNCPDWQTPLSLKLNHEHYDIINPRRKEAFDIKGNFAEEQITWEYNALKNVSHCSFWFPKETLCPITLFELGKMLVYAQSGKVKLIVGWEAEYQRAFDLETQIKLMNLYDDVVTVTGAGWDKLEAELIRKFG